MLTSTTFAAPLKREYGEIPQANPIRWCLYHYDADKEEFTAQTDWFKCKDFFNDVVAKYHGVDGGVYGMNFRKITLNDYGLWVRLKGLYPAFYDNVLLVAEKFQVTLNFAPFEDDSAQCLTLFPRELFDSTYKISLFTLLVRVANMTTKCSSYEELIKQTNEPLTTDHRFKRAPFTVPDKLKDYWCYMGKKYNSKQWDGRSSPQIEAVHDNGIFSWMSSDDVGAFQ